MWKGIVNFVGKWGTKLWNFVKEAVSKAYDKVKKFFGDIYDRIKRKVKDALDAVKNKLGMIPDKLAKFPDNALDKVTSWGLPDDLRDKASTAIDKFGNKFDLKTPIQNAIDGAIDILESFNPMNHVDLPSKLEVLPDWILNPEQVV